MRAMGDDAQHTRGTVRWAHAICLRRAANKERVRTAKGGASEARIVVRIRVSHVNAECMYPVRVYAEYFKLFIFDRVEEIILDTSVEGQTSVDKIKKDGRRTSSREGGNVFVGMCNHLFSAAPDKEQAHMVGRSGK